MNSKCLISVIIPAYNSEKFIEDTINSVLAQTYQNFEIIIVDDSSTDNTMNIVNRLAENNSKIFYYKIEHSGLPAVPRNFGINKAKGELIAFLDSDDIWTKKKLEEQLIYFDKFPNVILVYSMSVTFGSVNIFSPQYEVLPLIFRAANSRSDLINMGNSITCSSVLVQKFALEKVNGFDEDPKLKAIEDYDLWLRLSEIGNFYFIPKIHVKYRVHKTQSSSDWETKQKRLLYLAQKKNIPLKEYNFYRNKGLLFILPRNLIHFLTFIFVKLKSKLK